MIESTPPALSVAFAPHIRKALSTQRIMLDVILGLVPAVLVAGVYFRLHGSLLIGVSVASCLAAESACNWIRKKPHSLWDLSAMVTGVILALSLPPALPLWTAVIGAAFAIAIGKMVFGGLGANIFNPAMVGRAFLTASFGILMTTWTVPATLTPGLAIVAPTNNIQDIRTQATPLAWSKMAIKDGNGARLYNERQPFLPGVLGNSTVTGPGPRVWGGLLGEKAGSLGETSALALLFGGLYLLVRRIIPVHIPLAVLLSALVFASLAYFLNPDKYVPPFYHLTSGALLLGAFFIATDPVTAPLTVRGQWVFGILIGGFTMLVRIVGEYPEGFMYAVLLANSVRPLIDRFARPIPVGGVPHV